MTDTNKKNLPKIGRFKSEIYEILKGFDRDEIRRVMNTAISEDKGITYEEACNSRKKIKSRVVEKILMQF